MFIAVNVADRYLMGILRISFVSIYIILFGLGVEANSGACGGVLNQSQGFIQTPNFPGKFKVPIKCKWVIDASAHLPNATLTVHLTQLYVTTGLKFTGLPYYDPENTFALGEKFGESPVHNVSENNVLTINWLKTDSQYLAVYFELNQLEGNHIRALDNLLDVYGFNITYQVRNGLGNADSTCSVVRCSYNGHCFANHNFSEYRCVCFHGFSGKDCGEGPLCRPDRNPCMNNGTCRHVGSSSVICNCPASYTGSKCEIAIQPPSPDCPENEEKEADCVNYCAVRQHEAPCSCKLRRTKQVSERSRYQIAIQVATQSLESSIPNEHLKAISSRTSSHQFEKSITKYLKSRIPSFEVLKILNISFDGEIIFHIFARDDEEDNIKQSIGELIEQATLDNFTFTSATFNFKREPALFVKEMSVSPDRRSVRHGDEFIITCIAYGSQQITFRWLKNDILINVTKATREMSIINSPNHLLDHFTSILTVKSADALDSGLYTCQAIDWGAQHCKSVKLDVIAAPSVKVAPLTASIQKGQALNIICTWSLMNDDTKSIYGYSWLKERKYTSEAHLFKMREESEVWEDLQPVGSILRVYNIQKSTRYTCQVQSNAEPVEASVDVEVLNKSAIPWCESDDTGLGGVRWAEIGAWGAAKVECPARYAGVATRLCSVSAPGRAVWLTPDYSDCISEDLSRLAENFKKLTLGYGSTTGAYTMSKIYELLRDRSRLYPGEGETYLTLMQDIAWYLNFTMAWKDLLQSTPTFYNTINVILQHSNSIINSQKLIDLQKLVNHWTIAWTKHSRINRASVQSYDSLMIHTYCFNSSSTKLEYTFDISGNIRGYQSWSRTAVNILVARESLVVHGSTYSIAIIIYKDLMKYSPERQIYKMDDGTEWELEQATGNVVSLVGSSPMQVMVDVRMATALRQGWNVSCAAMTTPTARWMLEKCTVNVDVEASVTRCTCPMLATITALLTKTALQNGKKSTPKSDVVLILGCLCCIFQCVLSTALLLMRWYNNPSCLIFLKLQCCISVTAVAMVFFSAAKADIRESSYPFFVFSLEAFFLLGLSSHLTKLLLVYTEIIYLPKVKDMKLTVVGVINGFTLLIVLCNHLSYNSTRWRMESWWLMRGTFVFYAFIICISVMSAMFLFLYVSVMKRLAQLSSMKSISKEQTKAIKKRVCLLGRAALIFITILVMALMSIVYVNYPGLKSQYAFSLTCAFTGFVLLACYVLQSEASLHLHVMEKIGAKDVCTSDSESNILNFFTKQDGETESECAPPPPIKEPLTCRKESIQLKEITLRGLSSPAKEKAATNTKLVTLQSDLVQGCDVLKYASTLPKRRPRLTITRSESISNLSGTTRMDQSGNEHQVKLSSTHRSLDVLQSNQHHQDVLTTRVCVELGLVTNGDTHDNINEGPSIVLCSVDIEPCPGKVVELNEVTVKTTTTDVNGNGSSNSLTVANVNISRQNSEVCSSNRAFENPSQLDNVNGNCEKVEEEVSRTDRDVFKRISSDLQYLLQDYDANGNTNNRTVQSEQMGDVRSSSDVGESEEISTEGMTSL